NIYMTLCVLFLAQATNAHLTLGHLVGIVVFAMIASKGGAGVSGNAFITLAAIVATVPEIPIQALAVLLGIDLFMSECRALTNVVGNGVATLVVSRWEGELTGADLRDNMDIAMAAPVPEPEQVRAAGS
ncbi:MAG TPA: cation:dicarboxylase symporter family transporter, partial [Terriglobales bacterium]